MKASKLISVLSYLFILEIIIGGVLIVYGLIQYNYLLSFLGLVITGLHGAEFVLAGRINTCGHKMKEKCQ